jgi:AcrR family transcriptional regulator
MVIILPKIVNHDQRKKEIQQAVWKLIAEKGIEEVSFRKVAQSMHLTTGSIRYYFPTQEELLRYCIRSAGENVHQHILSHIDLTLPCDHVLQQLVSEILPLQETGDRDMVIWYSIIEFTRKQQNLQDIAFAIFQYMRHMQKSYLELLQKGNFLKEPINIPVETTRLHSLIIGLSTYWNIDPSKEAKKWIKEALYTHLQSLCK